MEIYVVSVTYPDGHTEEIEDMIYRHLDDAVMAGKNILGQVAYTEKTHSTGKHYSAGDEYFVVRRVMGQERTIVFDSRVSEQQ